MVIILKDTRKRTKEREIISKCRCLECGKDFESVRRNVKRGTVQSCGCSRSKDLVNKKFGLITVISSTKERSKYNSSIIWNCICDCGKKIKLSTNQLKHPNRQSCGCFKDNIIKSCKKRSGKNHHWYNHDLTDEERNKTRESIEDYSFRKGVFKRDNYTCQKCNTRGGDMNAHHLNGYHWFIEGRSDIDNGVTLCELCHKKFHEIYGFKNNTKEQFIKFKEDK